MSQRAVLIGINKFKKISGLNGCENDTTNLRSILKTYWHFENNDIRMLINDRATKAAIQDRVTNTLQISKAGDLVVIHKSAHGSQTRDRNGDELQDHMDELSCPYDMDWDGTYITDDDWAEWLALRPAGVHVEVIFDLCHAGTGTRNMVPTEHPRANRYSPPPMDIACRSEGEDLPVKRLLKAGIEVCNPTQSRGFMTHILWAGCRFNQTCADAYIEGSYNGAFTYYFCDHIRKTNGKVSRLDLLNRVRNSLKHNDYEQVPQLETSRVMQDVFSPEGAI